MGITVNYSLWAMIGLVGFTLYPYWILGVLLLAPIFEVYVYTFLLALSGLLFIWGITPKRINAGNVQLFARQAKNVLLHGGKVTWSESCSTSLPTGLGETLNDSQKGGKRNLIIVANSKDPQ
jgi:hypothetical protein